MAYKRGRTIHARTLVTKRGGGLFSGQYGTTMSPFGG
jgi:hypothetical protein